MSDRVRLWTADDIYDPDVENIELIYGRPVGGKLVRRRMGEFRRFVAEGALLWHVGRFAIPRRLGVVLPGAGFVTPDGRGLLPPDIAFYRFERLPHPSNWDGLPQTPPDLIADVLSVNAAAEWYGERNDGLVAAYLAAGVGLAWILDPRGARCASSARTAPRGPSPPTTGSTARTSSPVSASPSRRFSGLLRQTTERPGLPDFRAMPRQTVARRRLLHSGR